MTKPNLRDALRLNHDYNLLEKIINQHRVKLSLPYDGAELLLATCYEYTKHQPTRSQLRERLAELHYLISQAHQHYDKPNHWLQQIPDQRWHNQQYITNKYGDSISIILQACLEALNP